VTNPPAELHHDDPDRVDLLMALSYYFPYVSGLTNAARNVAEGLATRGWKVRVVTTQHERGLSRHERINGIEVVRTPVLAHVGKGMISPHFLPEVIRSSKNADVVNIHLPMLEAGPIARFSASPVVLTYQCDVSLPAGLLNNLQRRVIDASSRVALRHSRAVGVTSEDYASHSRVADAMTTKTVAIPAPCLLRDRGVPSFRRGPGLHVGFLGRIVEEKGIEYLIDGFLAMDDPDAQLLIAGDFLKIAGGSVVERVRRRIGGDGRIRLLGFVAEADMADFYASIDVFALPSVNAFEAFGIAQVEAMMVGVPVLASNMPGVRVPVQRTGFGVVTEPRDTRSIRDGLVHLRDEPPDREAGTRIARDLYSIDAVLDAYAATFNKARSPGM